MWTEDLRQFYLRYVALVNRRDFDHLDEFIHDEVTINGVQTSRDAMIASLRKHTEAIPDLAWDVQGLVIQGNRIAARLRDEGTPRREWSGLRPTGARVSFDECAFYEIREGRISATWYLMDTDAVRQQLAAS